MEGLLHHQGFSTALNKAQERLNSTKQWQCKSNDIGS